MKKLMLVIFFLLAGCGKKEGGSVKFHCAAIEAKNRDQLIGYENGIFAAKGWWRPQDATADRSIIAQVEISSCECRQLWQKPEDLPPHSVLCGACGPDVWLIYYTDDFPAPQKEDPICGYHWKSKDEEGRDVFNYREGPCPESPAPHKKSSDEAFAELMTTPCSDALKFGTIAFAMTIKQSDEWERKVDTCFEQKNPHKKTSDVQESSR